MIAENQLSSRIGVAVVTYFPAAGWEARLAKMAAQGEALVVVDDGSPAEMRQAMGEVCRRHGWELILQDENRGLAAALNRAVGTLATRGFPWALLFDQDSEPAEDMSRELLATVERWPVTERVAVVGACFRDATTGRPHCFLRPHRRCGWWFEKTATAESDLAVSMVITSGSLVRIAAFEAAGGFDEAFFIDHVDTDFCLRCRRAGWVVVASARARMDHALGNRTVERWGGWTIRPTHHAPLRHYYIARNRVTMIKRHAVRAPHWFLFELAAAGLWLFRVVAAESRKKAKLAAMMWGTWDGARGRGGKISEERARRLR
jgi:rhamnosyltransferase